MVSCVSAISIRLPAARITLTPATCPAEVMLVNDMIIAIKGESPPVAAATPKPKETDRYPSPIGMLSEIPLRNVYFEMLLDMDCDDELINEYFK